MRLSSVLLAIIGLSLWALECGAAENAAAGQWVVKDPSQREKIEQALPEKAPVRPKKPRKLLIFELNVNYGGHPSIAHASYAFMRMGEKTGAFQTVISSDPAIFKPESLKQFDAVFFNNNVGNLFTDAALRKSLVEFVYSGGGMMGVHGSTVAFTAWPGATEDWAEFGLMIGGRGANHRDSDEHAFIKLDDPANPILQCFGGKDFEYRDELFRVHDPYSRNRLRILFSIDMSKTDVNQGGAPRGAAVRADNDYALAWIRNYGRGRTFYCTIAHNPSVFWDKRMLEFYLAAAQFALGDLPAPTTPSARLTPAIRAQEKLGWRLGLNAGDGRTLFESIDQAAQSGVLYVGAHRSQTVSRAIGKPFDSRLSDDELGQVRMKLDSAGVRLLSYCVDQPPAADVECRGLFAFARKMGVEAIIADPQPQMLATLDNLCEEFGLKLAIRGQGSTPESILKTCQGRSIRIGAFGDFAAWARAGIDPLKAAQSLQDRLLIVQLPPATADAEQLLKQIRSPGIAPVMFAVDPSPDTGRAVSGFNEIAIQLAK